MFTPEKRDVFFEVAGERYRLLRFRLNSTGSLMVVMDAKPTKEMLNGSVKYPVTALPPKMQADIPLNISVTSQHYTIHPSAQMPYLSEIHYKRLDASGGKPHKRKQFTKAIKRHNGFALVVSFITPGITRFPKLQISSPIPAISLGRIPIPGFAPVAAMFVGARTSFFRVSAGDYSVVQFVMGPYRIVFLVSFLSFPFAGLDIHSSPETEDPSTITDSMKKLLNDYKMMGFDDTGVDTMYRFIRERLKIEAVDYAKMVVPPDKLTPQFEEWMNLGYLRRFRSRSIELARHFERARAKGLLP